VNYSKICSYLSQLKLGKWILEVFNEGKKPQILEISKTYFWVNIEFFRKNDSKKNSEN